MTPDQVKAARALLGWNIVRLAARSGTSKYMVIMFERTGRVAPLYVRTEQVDGLAAMRAALEAAGVEFTNGDAPGVRIRSVSQG